MDNKNLNQKTNRPNRQGSNNPMFGRHHSEITKRKQSDAAIKRNQELKKWKDGQQKPMTMDEFLSNNPSVKEYLKVLASKIIKEEIDKCVWEKQRQQMINIPL